MPTQRSQIAFFLFNQIVNLAEPHGPEGFWARAKAIVDVLQPSVTIAALIAGGIWTYMIFVHRREARPRLQTQHEVVHMAIDAERRWVRVKLYLKNIGDVLVRTDAYDIYVQQVLPIDPDAAASAISIQSQATGSPREIDWPLLQSRVLERSKRRKGAIPDPVAAIQELRLEPKEADELVVDFVIPAEVSIIQVYSHIQNVIESKRQIGWQLTTLHCLTDTSSLRLAEEVRSACGKAATPNEADKQEVITTPQANAGATIHAHEPSSTS